jgi:hypothetical protein
MKGTNLSKWETFNPQRYEQGSPMWQLSLIIANLEDPRFARGADLLCLLIAVPIIVTFSLGAFIWVPPAQCPAPQETTENVG